MEHGVTINPIAFLVIQSNNVKLMPVNHSSSLDKLLDYVPDLLEKTNNIMNRCVQNKKEETSKIVKEIQKRNKEKEEKDKKQETKIKEEIEKKVEKTKNIPEDVEYEFEYDETIEDE